MSNNDLDFLATLESIIHDRLVNPGSGSYTASLAASGVQRIAQKVGEEGVELALAAVAGEHDDVVNEAADLVYHLLVLLQARELGLAEVVACLEQRHSQRS